MENTLYYGDNLSILRDLAKAHPQGCIDLIYVDPPFNSNRNYNILYQDLIQNKANGAKVTAQKEAFKDTWSNVEINAQLAELKGLPNLDAHKFITGNRGLFSPAQTSYLTMMAIRIYYMRKVLKRTGSFYLHCDSNMSHYLKILCDIIFGRNNFRNEITWKRGELHALAEKAYNNIADVILFYSHRQNENAFHLQHTTLSEEEKKFRHTEKETGRKYQHIALEHSGNAYNKHEIRIILGKEVRTHLGWRWTQDTLDKRLQKNPYLVYWTKKGRPRYKLYADEHKGTPLGNIWTDIPYLSSNDAERLGYPTQKPEKLLARIIHASSNPGDVVADFFCGCGTTVTVAEKLKRKWIGVDISHLAVGLVEQKRLQPLKAVYDVWGLPKDLAQAEKLASEAPFKFQDWVVEYLLKGHSNKRKTGDGGYDGHLSFKWGKTLLTCLIEIKGGRCGVKNVREFQQVITTEKAVMGIFACFSKHITSGMKETADQTERVLVEDQGQRMAFSPPKLAVLPIEELMAGKKPPSWFTGILQNATYS